jgi:hypothetical protein
LLSPAIMSIAASGIVPVVVSVVSVLVVTAFRLEIPQGGIAVVSLVAVNRNRNRNRNPQTKHFIVSDVCQHESYHLRVPSVRSTL